MQPENTIDAPGLSVGPTVGSMVGPYRLVREIGRGGMGVVFEGVHSEIGQRVAVKLLLPSGSSKPSSTKRFLGEAKALSRVAHPGLVHVLACGEAPNQAPWIAMEYITGQTLRRRMDQHPGGLPIFAAVGFARQIASAIAAVHKAGIVHRDLKPENVLLTRDDEVKLGERAKVLDFGIAKWVDDDAGLTTEGIILGTAGYMAPEQCVGDQSVESPADVYALGIILYECLCGARPFVGPAAAVLRQHLFAEPPPLSTRVPGLPNELHALVSTMIAKEPSLRPSSDDVAYALRSLEDGLAGTPDIGEPTFRSFSPAIEGAITEPNLPTFPSNTGGTTTERAAFSPSNEPVPPTPVARPKQRLVFAAAIAGAAVLGAAGWWTQQKVKSPPAAILPGMVYLAGGTFVMGSSEAELTEACTSLKGGCTPEEKPQLDREKPARSVTVSAFQLDTTEVTNEKYASFLNITANLLDVRDDRDDKYPRFVMDRELGHLLVDLHPDKGGIQKDPTGAYTVRSGRAQLPVVQVTWDGAVQYCRHLGKRLPTEAEWEHAARGPERRLFPWGNEAPRCDGVRSGREDDRACPGLPAELGEVGSSPQDVTPQGVKDLGGNAGEWVQDQFILPYYGDCGSCVNPMVEQTVPLAEDYRIFRGGTFWSVAWLVRGSTRNRWKRTQVMDGVGFRCAVGM
ncbi:MAG: SUMF1/EgtB/PvdO family nonheme iron enzyme [Polyangiaceae bacterium]|nr:SUMF1/EgtB/PvdO family nonheme iron enzyme [Polyangiaceae bacterium]